MELDGARLLLCGFLRAASRRHPVARSSPPSPCAWHRGYQPASAA